MRYFPGGIPPTVPTLPPEIIDRIIEQIDPTYARSKQEMATLKACSLVSSAWSKIAQRHLFSHLTFSNDARSADFLCTAIMSPDTCGHLIRHIRCIRTRQLAWEIGNLPPPQTPQMELEMGLYLGSSFPQFLDKLEMLWEIDFALSALAWDWLQPDERQSFIRVFQLPSLKRVSMDMRGGFPLVLTSLFGPNVETLCIGGCGLSSITPKDLENPSTSMSESNPPPPLTIKHLVLGTEGDVALITAFVLHNPSNTLSLRFLQSMELILSHKNRARVQPSQFLSFFGLCPHLSRLTILLERHPLFEYQRPKSDQMRLSIWHPEGLNPNAFYDRVHLWIPPLVESRASLHKLENVTIEYHFHQLVNHPEFRITQLYQEKWNNLDEFFDIHCPLLANMELIIGIRGFGYEIPVLIHLENGCHFLRLRKKGVFKGFQTGQCTPHWKYFL